MDVASCFQDFESRLSSYTGDDPLDLWVRLVEFLGQRFPADGGMMQVFENLVQRFLNVERYANDIRYVTHCIRCAGFYSDPIALYSYVFSRGVGTRTAALYVAWAQQFELRGMNDQAEAVFQKALENQAQPVQTVLHEHRQFQTRTRSQTPASGGQNPLQNSHRTNQMSHGEPVAPHKASSDCPPKAPVITTVITVSRSETSGSGSCAPTVSMYLKDELVREGAELSFEEVRAEKYFRKLREHREWERREQVVREQEEELLSTMRELEKLNQQLEASGGLSGPPAPQRPPAALNPAQQSSGRLSSRRSLGLRPHTESFLRQAEPSALPDRSASMVQPPASAEQMNLSLHRPAAPDAFCLEVRPDGSEAGRPQGDALGDAGVPAEPTDKLNMSQGAAGNLSHITPNTSLGFVQATPSRLLPSPTVNTQEALDVIMDMFQAPTLLADPFNNTAALPERPKNGGISFVRTPSAAAFTIFQDGADKENGRAPPPPAAEKPKPVRALADIQTSKPNDTPPQLMPDESTMWGARYNSLNSLAACPNSTTDFAMLAQFVSTPSAHKTPFNGNFFQDKENDCDGGDAEDDTFIRRQLKKLSPIMEQSPADDTAASQLAGPSDRHGTIVGLCLTSSSSVTLVQPPPPAVLSFRDQTVCPAESSLSRTSAPSWDVYTSPRQACVTSQSPVGPQREPFTIMEDLDHRQDVPMSPESALKPDWLTIRSPAAAVETDLDAFLSPCRLHVNDAVPMSPDRPPLRPDVPMSPVQSEEAAGPQRGVRVTADVSMNATPAKTKSILLPTDPWDDGLIRELLSTLRPPITAHPRCISWQCNLPHITPKTTISMGKAALRVDCLLGEGAFASAYRATDPVTSERVVLKVQKPANPWEFYVNTQLDARLQPAVRHLYGSIRSAHLFHNGSVMLGELHSHGTLLNAVNVYKTLTDKVMPQALVMYFTVCILNMVELLHHVHIIHADVKPDNFLFGERFLENKCFEPDHLGHGLVLIDVGQSIDMELFPEGTAFTAKCMTSGFQCTEMLSGKPWNYQTDYFGIAGTVHCMLFGTYMQVMNDGGVWKTNGIFRRNPHGEFWQQLFYTLLNVPDCRSLPSLRGLRDKVASVLQQSYGSKLSSLKSRMVVLLLEHGKAARR